MSGKFYAVRNGRVPGIYRSWDECKSQVHSFSGAVFKTFKTLSEAERFISVDQDTRASLKSKASRGPRRGVVFASTSQTTTAKNLDADKQIVYPETTMSPSPLTSVGSGKRKHSELEGVPEALKVEDKEWCLLFFDGASKGNPGRAGAGAVLSKEATDEEIGRICVRLPHATNNVAEYTALIRGMEAAAAIGVKKLNVKGDSKLVVEQVSNRWKVSNEGLRPLHKAAGLLKSQFTQFRLNHIFRHNNSVADKLANEGVEGGGWEGLRYPGGLFPVKSVLDGLSSQEELGRRLDAGGAAGPPKKDIGDLHSPEVVFDGKHKPENLSPEANAGRQSIKGRAAGRLQARGVDAHASGLHAERDGLSGKDRVSRKWLTCYGAPLLAHNRRVEVRAAYVQGQALFSRAGSQYDRCTYGSPLSPLHSFCRSIPPKHSLMLSASSVYRLYRSASSILRLI